MSLTVYNTGGRPIPQPAVEATATTPITGADKRRQPLAEQERQEGSL